MQFPYYYTPVAGNYSPAERDEMFGMIRNADTPGNLASYNGVLALAPRPNLLDNAYFVGRGTGYGVFPVNQRGQTQYSGSNNYFDRWKGSTNISATLQSDGVLISSSGSSDVSFYQGLPIEPLLGKTVTGSILTADGTLYVGTGTVPSSVPASGNVYAFSIDTDVGKFNLAYVSVRSQLEFTITLPGAGRSIKLAAAKLEVGSIQTLAHQENGVWVLNEIPRYDDELLKCQRYYTKFTYSGFIGRGYTNANTAVVSIVTPVAMQIVNSVSGFSRLSCLINGNWYQVASISILSQTNNVVTITCSFASGTTFASNLDASLALDSHNAAYLELSAEL